MTTFLLKFQPIDIIAIVVLVGGFILLGFGVNTVVGGILTTVVLAYFGKKEIIDKVIEKNLPEQKFETIEHLIKRVAKDEGVDPGICLRVAKCESGLNPAAKGFNNNVSVDRGLFQWNSKWHPEISDVVAYDPEKSTRAFCEAFKGGHLSWWDATKKCWKV